MIRATSLALLSLMLASAAAAQTYVPGKGHVHALRARRAKPSEARATSPRLYLGPGFDVVLGFETQVNGEPNPDDRAIPYDELASISGVLRFDVPVHPMLLLGAQVTGSSWTTRSEDQLGYSPHLTFDIGAVARARLLALGSYGRHEVLASIVLGPTFDTMEPGRRSYGETVSDEVGLHTGLFASYQYFPIRSHFGIFAEGGLTYRYIPKTFEYAIEGQRSSDDITYQPIALFGRLGLMLVLFQ